MHRNQSIAPLEGGSLYREAVFDGACNVFFEKESLYRYAIELSHQILWVSDTEGHILYIGPGWAEMIGYPLEDLLGYGWMQFVHPDDAARLQQARRETLISGASYECEYRIRAADGSYRWFRSSAGARRNEAGAVILWYGTTQDIQDRKLAELTHQGQTRVLEMIAAGRPLDEVLTALCRLAEDQIAGARCSILLFDPERGLLRHGAAPNLPPAYNAAIDLLPIGPDAGSCGPAAYTRSPVIVSDIANDPLWAPWRDLALQHDLQACWSKPILSRSGDVLGTFGFYYAEPRSPTRSEMAGIDAVSHLAALAIERQRSEAALRDSEEHYRYSVELNPQIPWTADGDGNVLTTSPRWTQLTGGSPDGTADSNWEEAIHPQDLPLQRQKWLEAVRTSEPLDAQCRGRLVDGSYRWFRTRAIPHLAEDGTVIRWYGTVEDIHDRKIAEEQLHRAAYHDDLTGLANRRFFRERLKQVLDEVTDESHAIGLLVMDLDHLKQINDRFGHDAGDNLLKEFAQRLRQAVKPTDVVARLGGDEFAVILPDVAGEEEVAEIARTILCRMQEPLKRSGKALDCRTSIGGAIALAAGTSPEDLQKQADLALYHSKSSGRGAFKMFVPALRQEAQRTASALEVAAKAVEAGWIMPFYQPKVVLASGAIGGFEALLRWQHPRGGIQSPEKIAPAFNDTELGTAIGERMRACVLSDMRRWLDAGLNLGRIAINASAAEFRRDNYAERVLEELRQAGVPAHCLEVEVTESVFLGSSTQLVERALRALSAEGVTIALDDFGTGYASLSHLKRFPVNTLKIDRTFVQDLEADAGDAAIVKAVLNLGHNLGIEVVAEGVETAFQASLLQRMSCDLVQGYHFGRPMPGSDVPSFLASWQGM
ncbi:bifunctional diguanylate cyclase/phosphodiesterase [Microvirga arabica]|uniref:bifunctional diguanylate cyclase/phosphodiesterase n=1 Tax=Microvirga arabica TaxID=1128671 RepID=UPI00193941AA|nr:GGDEF domain-containing phosphodiesterase [Microvirga arabica]MBM1171045.1 EAL domain-containing protein [Microvirga arabica]